jgi:hypothetical protein
MVLFSFKCICRGVVKWFIHMLLSSLQLGILGLGRRREHEKLRGRSEREWLYCFALLHDDIAKGQKIKTHLSLRCHCEPLMWMSYLGTWGVWHKLNSHLSIFQGYAHIQNWAYIKDIWTFENLDSEKFDLKLSLLRCACITLCMKTNQIGSADKL